MRRQPGPSPLVSTVAVSGIALETWIHATATSIAVEARATNERRTPVHLVPNQCGRLTEALLVRTVMEPEGASWTGSAGALKSIALDRQASNQAPERFHPRRPGDARRDRSIAPPAATIDMAGRSTPGARRAAAPDVPGRRPYRPT
jgi:hypothetical protein